MTDAEFVILANRREMIEEGERIAKENGGFIRPRDLDMKGFYDFCTEFSERFGEEGDELLRRHFS